MQLELARRYGYRPCYLIYAIPPPGVPSLACLRCRHVLAASMACSSIPLERVNRVPHRDPFARLGRAAVSDRLVPRLPFPREKSRARRGAPNKNPQPHHCLSAHATHATAVADPSGLVGCWRATHSVGVEFLEWSEGTTMIFHFLCVHLIFCHMPSS